jgi:hypothetical protein
MSGKINKNVSDRIRLSWADFSRNPNGPAQYCFARGGKRSKSNLTGGAYVSAHLTHRTGTLPLDSNPTARLRRVRRRGRELTCTERKTTATARREGEAELDGAGRKRFLRHSSSSSRRPLAQRRPNAVAPPASSSSPAELATSNGRELGEEKMSGSSLGVG